MSIEGKVFKNVTWLALFKMLSQGFSWLSTIIVARILVPSDYGLLEMATILTGYAAILNELGLGSAIIQRQSYTENELSSTFWFGIAFSLLLAVGCIGLAYPTAALFHNVRLIPLTQSVSILFVLSGLQIVQGSLLQKQLMFKRLGFIEMSSVLISCISMVVFAFLHFGVWTLILGNIVQNFTRLLITFYFCRWLPKFHYNWKEAKSFLSFGISVALSSSLFYLYNKSDKFFAGKVWTPTQLGRYSFALNLARIPTEKIVVLINQVSFPAFAKIQNNEEEFRRLYLNILRVTSTLVMPMFVGISLVANEIVHVLLNEKWYSMVSLFQWLCLIQIPTALNAVNGFVHTAQGRPSWSLKYTALLAIGMPVAFYFCANSNVNNILIPWYTVYAFFTVGWVVVTLRKIRIHYKAYFQNLLPSFAATGLMSCTVFLCKYFLQDGPVLLLGKLIIEGLVGASIYVFCLWVFDKKIFSYIKTMRTTVS